MTGEGSGHAAWRPPAQTYSPSAPESLVGYSDLREIGVGGDSVVYRAVEDTLRRDVAIKVLNVDDEVRAARFAREVEITLELGRQHPNIVTVLATGITGSGRPAIVMDFYPGGTVHDRLREFGPLPVDEVVRIGTVLSDALSFAHDRGVLHRDVKPQNVLVLPTSWVLADFGIARLVDSEHTGSVATFTYRHASPQVLDGHGPTASDDIWSLGSTLFTLVDGRPPFASDDPENDSALAYLRRARTEDPRTLRVPGAEALAEVIGRCLAKDTADRWSSAAEVHDELLGLRHRGWEPDPGVSAVSASSSSQTAASTADPADAPEPESFHRAHRDHTSGAWAPAAPAHTPPPATGSLSSSTTVRGGDPTTPRSRLENDRTGQDDQSEQGDRAADQRDRPPAPVALSAAAHVPAFAPADAEPTGMGFPEDQGPPTPARPVDPAAPRPAKRRRRLVLALGAVALVIGTTLGVVGAVLRHDDPTPTSATEDPKAGHAIPELPQKPDDVDPKTHLFDPELAFTIKDFRYEDGSLIAAWGDPSKGEAKFSLTELSPDYTFVRYFDPGFAAADFPMQLGAGRTCFVMVLHMPDGRLGRSDKERCVTVASS